MKTRVVVLGAGPAGLLLSQLLGARGIAHVVLEQR
ncbi:MAG: FAD-dependent monooxygenase, partial [Myxococcales bacterium]|nr:FAD-dependent monooxygenase [Myxococcales bacterium]